MRSSRKKGLFFSLLVALLSSCALTGKSTPENLPSPTRTVDTVMPFHLPTQTNTPNPYAYYLTAETQERLRKVLSDNGGCKLPCLWGITPGKTDWDSAYKYLKGFHKIRTDNHPERLYENENWPIYGVPLQFVDVKKRPMSIGVNVTVGDGLVQRIHLHAGTNTGDDMNAYLSYYSLKQIFSWLGLPDKIYFYIYQNDIQHSGYNLLVLYQTPKAAVWLFGDSNEEKEICPQIQADGQITSMKISLANPDSPLNIIPIGWEFWSENDEKENLTTEDVFGISLDEFYQKVLADNELCLPVILKP